MATVRDWLAGRVPKTARDDLNGTTTCIQCGHPSHDFSELTPEYVYLLGLYLGDGSISAYAKSVFRLRVFLDLRYPMIVDECEAAIRTVMPRSWVHRQLQQSYFTGDGEPSFVIVSAFSKAWPCFFPQHGPGRKHQRRIMLAGWQQALVERSPRPFLRGLIHSDGCRFQNTGRGDWSWPRYSFRNKSADILNLFCLGCDHLGLRWTRSGTETIYVSRKADVAILDSFIGPKA